jgi:adenylyl-sulfate kinase
VSPARYSRSHPGATLWFTGLSGAGKSTLAEALRDRLLARAYRVQILDGDEVRQNLSKGLGFSKDDRDTNVRRIGYVSWLLSRNGVVVITAAISPYREVRDEIRAAHEVRFVEVFVDCSISELVRRDRKGLYAKALSGEIDHFTGVSDPYEAPVAADVTVHTDRESVETSLERILEWLERETIIEPEPATVGVAAGTPMLVEQGFRRINASGAAFEADPGADAARLQRRS